MNQLVVSPSPHLRTPTTTQAIMRDVLIALVPAIIASVVFFGVRALILTLVCIAASVLFEFLFHFLKKQPNTVTDLSAAVTGTLLAFCLPADYPIWMAIIGCFIAIVIVKQLFGGLGANFANPAIVARIALMLSFSSAMEKWPQAMSSISGATPLADEALRITTSNLDLFLGKMGGTLGEVSALALLIGAAYLIFRRVITIDIPVSFLGTMAIFALLVGESPVFHLLTGGAILGAFFMATDYVTSPTTTKGKIIYGVGCGLITMVIRVYGNFPEGVSFAILLMNILTPHIDNATQTKPLGGVTNE